MAANIARLTLYHIISAFEADVRIGIDIYLSSKADATSILPPDMFLRVSERAKSDGATASEAQNLSNLIDYLDFGDLIQIFRRHVTAFPEQFSRKLKQLTSAVDHLAVVRNRVMHGRPLEFDDLATTLDLCESLLAGSSPWSELRRASRELSETPEAIFRATIPVSPEISAISHNLPLPDFDETGFIGRRDSLRSVTAAIRGVYPVITIVGEGGLGKTSLALKAAYDLLDSQTSAFDAIIFATAKTSQLTATEIRRIEGAVNSSLGLMSAAVEALSGATDNPIEDLVQLLTEFSVLLILDNLETVIDENVRTLARDMPPGSKLLITSRIGLGAFEFPIILEGLAAGESMQLLRSFAKASGVQRLSQMPDEKLMRYCEKMRRNPLHIKWFVSAVAAGKRPEEILADERMFLKFCLSNVYDRLSDSARKVVRTLLSVGGANSTSEIAYLANIDEIDTIRAIQELLKTNMFIASSSPVATTFTTKYELSQLSRSYLSRFYPVAKEEQDSIIKAKRQLVSVGEQLVAESRKNPLSPYLIHCRDKSDAVPAKHLSDALRSLRAGDIDDAYKSVERARTLSPEFYEVARVEAWIHAHTGNVSEAYDAYERAVELESNAPHVWLYYGGFVLASMQDADEALVRYQKARDLLPEHPELIAELARCYLYLKDYKLSLEALTTISTDAEISERLKRKIRDLHIQVYQRRAESLIIELGHIDALKSLEELREYCMGVDFFDQRMRQRLASTLQAVGAIRQGVRGDNDLEGRVDEYHEWIVGLLDLSQPKRTDIEGRDIHFQDATFLRLAGGGKFGFAEVDGVGEVFIHESQFTGGLFNSLLKGDRLSLEVVLDYAGRRCGEHVRRL